MPFAKGDFVHQEDLDIGEIDGFQLALEGGLSDFGVCLIEST